MADIKNVIFKSATAADTTATITDYKSSVVGSNWVITITLKIVMGKYTSVSSSIRDLVGTINGQDIGVVNIKPSTVKWSAGKTYTYTKTITILYDSSKQTVAAQLKIIDRTDGKVGDPATFDMTGYTMTMLNSGMAYIKVAGVYKNGEVSIKVAGTWRKATGVYTKINGVWRESAS